MRKPYSCLLFAIVTAAASSAYAEEEENEFLTRRVRAVQAMVSSMPGGYEQHFDASFLKKVPPAKLTSFFVERFGKGGKVLSTVRTEVTGRFGAAYRFYSAKASFPIKIGISPIAPHLITTLWFGRLSPNLQSLNEVTAKLKQLPGKVSFALWKLGNKKPQPLAELGPNIPLAIASTFKLYLLGALADAIDRSQHRWDEVISLDERHKSWPSGDLHRWPDRIPETVASLAGRMISKSDNTATDHLLFFLGRKRIEAMMATMGHSQPSLNYPFLSTREAFLLQDPEAPKRLKDYISLDTTHRRAYLDKVLAKLSRKDLRSVHSQPTAITQVEWFASAADLCRAMDWFRTLQATKNQPGAVDILAINRGLSFQEKRWSYIGYKGGSEPGVLNLTWLLRRAGDNQWLALSAGWNNDQTNLDEDKLIEVIQGLIVLLER